MLWNEYVHHKNLAEEAMKEVLRLRAENIGLRTVATAATKVRAERIAFLNVAKAICPARSPALEQAEAEMDAALDTLNKST
jgi:hypothetical protein